MKRHLENDSIRIAHMLDAARKIIQFTAGKSRVDLDSDEILSLAVVRLLEIIGEAARHVTDETRASYPNIEWQDIADMRNRVIHGYFDIIWDTVSVNIPTLINRLESIPPNRH